jgi:xylulokinase
VLALASRPVTLSSPRAGWAEEDPAEWWANACAIVPELLRQAGLRAEAIGALGTTGMLPAVVLLDDAGRVLRPSIQQSDGRVGAQVAELAAELDAAAFLARTGNGINQQLVATKLRWLARHEPEVFARIATVFGSYDYVNWRLTGARHVEANWALEAGFVDLATGTLADDLVGLARVKRGAIPPCAERTRSSAP